MGNQSPLKPKLAIKTKNELMRGVARLEREDDFQCRIGKEWTNLLAENNSRDSDHSVNIHAPGWQTKNNNHQWKGFPTIDDCFLFARETKIIMRIINNILTSRQLAIKLISHGMDSDCSVKTISIVPSIINDMVAASTPMPIRNDQYSSRLKSRLFRYLSSW